MLWTLLTSTRSTKFYLLCPARVNKGSTHYAVNHKKGFTSLTASKKKNPSVSVPLFCILEQTYVNPSKQAGILYIRFYTKAAMKNIALKEPQLRIWNNTSPPAKKWILQGGAKDCLPIAVEVSVDDEI